VEEVQCHRRKVGLDWENETSIFFIIVFVLIGSVSAIPNDADSSIDFTYPDSTNYSTINVNDSIYWDGNAWSDARWLNIDGGNANQNIDIGAWNFFSNTFYRRRKFSNRNRSGRILLGQSRNSIKSINSRR